MRPWAARSVPPTPILPCPTSRWRRATWITTAPCSRSGTASSTASIASRAASAAAKPPKASARTTRCQTKPIASPAPTAVSSSSSTSLVGLAARALRGPLRGDAVQRHPGRRGPRGAELHLHQSPGFLRPAVPVAWLPVLRRQHPARPPHVADLDLHPGSGRGVRGPLRRQHRHARRRRRHLRATHSNHGLPVERQGRAHGPSRRDDEICPEDSCAQPPDQRALHQHSCR